MHINTKVVHVSNEPCPLPREVRSAKSAKASESKLDALMKEMLAMKKAMSATDNRPHDKRTPNPLSDTQDKPGYCQVVKCKNKV